MVVSFYDVLGIKPSASLQEVRMAFKQCALVVHPDKGGTDAKFQEASLAFETLIDAVRRKQHDCDLSRNWQLPRRKRAREGPVSTRTMQKRQKQNSSNACCHRRNAYSKTTTSVSFKSTSAQQQAGFSRRQNPAAQLYKLLQQMEPASRREVLSKKFSEMQRLALERWILQERQPVCHRQEREAKQHYQNFGDSLQKRRRTARHKDGPKAPEFCRLSGRVQICGIGSHLRRGKIWYNASTTIGMMHFVTKEVLDLALAIDFQVVLSGIKQQATQGANKTADAFLFTRSIKEAVKEAEKDNRLDLHKDLGLRFCVRVPAWRWIGAELVTPWFRVSDLERGLNAWCQLHEARGQIQTAGYTFQPYNPEDHRTTWIKVRETFLAILDDLGHFGARRLAKLDAKETSHRIHEERAVERWNQCRMAQEERCQIAAQRFEGKRERLERLQMAKADVASRRVQRQLKSIERRIDHWLNHWAKPSHATSTSTIISSKLNFLHLKPRRLRGLPSMSFSVLSSS